jgi:hypothetical protein
MTASFVVVLRSLEAAIRRVFFFCSLGTAVYQDAFSCIYYR